MFGNVWSKNTVGDQVVGGSLRYTHALKQRHGTLLYRLLSEQRVQLRPGWLAGFLRW